MTMTTNGAILPQQPASEANPQPRDPTNVNTKTLFDRMRDEAQAGFRNRHAVVEQAVAAPPEDAAMLGYRWAVPVELVRRLLALENLAAPQYVLDRLAALEKVPALVEILTKRIGLLEKELDELVARVKVIQETPRSIAYAGGLDLFQIQRDVAGLKSAVGQLQQGRK